MAISGFNSNQSTTNNVVNTQTGSNLANNSGQGKDSPVLDIVSKKFNWGAFLLSWIWGLGNRTYITLLMFVGVVLNIIPFLGLVVQLGLCIWFGVKGNTWAWQNKQWKSIEHFHEVQKKWAIAGLIVFIIFSVLIPIIVLCIALPILLTNTNELEGSILAHKAVNEVQEVVIMNEAFDNKCELTSEGLAKCFSDRMNTTKFTGNSFQTTATKDTYTFTGNGSCLNKGDCYVTITTKNKTPITIPLYAKANGHLEIKSEDINQYLTK